MEFYKTCTKCHKPKPLDNFYYDISVDRCRADCKDCNKKYKRRSYSNDLDNQRNRHKVYRENNLEKEKVRKHKQYLRKKEKNDEN